MEKVSIIVPMYNVEKYIRRCLESLLTQTYPLVEIIAISDASPDKSAVIANEMAAEVACNVTSVVGGGGELLNVIILKKNVGLGSVRDIGVGMASGKYVMFVDSDDYVHPQIVETCVNAMESGNCQMAQVDYVRTSAFTADFRLIAQPQCEIVEGLHIEDCSDHISCAKLYLTDIIRKHGLKMIYRSFEDTAFTRAYSLLCKKAVFIHEVMYFYYVNPDSATATMSAAKISQSIARANDVIEVYKQHGLTQKAEVYRLASQKVLIRNLLRMPKGTKLELTADMTVHPDTHRVIKLFNGHRILFGLYGCSRLGLKFTVKHILKTIGLMK